MTDITYPATGRQGNITLIFAGDGEDQCVVAVVEMLEHSDPNLLKLEYAIHLGKASFDWNEKDYEAFVAWLVTTNRARKLDYCNFHTSGGLTSDWTKEWCPAVWKPFTGSGCVISHPLKYSSAEVAFVPWVVDPEEKKP